MQAIESKTFNKRQARQARQEAAKAAQLPKIEDVVLTTIPDGAPLPAHLEPPAATVVPDPKPAATVVVANASNSASAAIATVVEVRCLMARIVIDGNRMGQAARVRQISRTCIRRTRVPCI